MINIELELKEIECICACMHINPLVMHSSECWANHLSHPSFGSRYWCLIFTRFPCLCSFGRWQSAVTRLGGCHILLESISTFLSFPTALWRDLGVSHRLPDLAGFHVRLVLP